MEAKDDEERAQIMAQARKDARLIKATYKERQEKIIIERRGNLQRNKEFGSGMGTEYFLNHGT